MKSLRLLRSLLRRLPGDPRAVALHARLRSSGVGRAAGGRTHEDAGERVLVQCLEDVYYLGLFAHLCQALRGRSVSAVDLFVPRSFNARVGADLKAALVRAFPFGRLVANQWLRLYDGVVADRVGYRSASLRHPVGDLVDAWRSWRAWRRLRSATDLESLAIDGVHCGDLVIDSYLRFRPSPRIELGDLFLVALLWQAHRDVRRARRYFRSVRPRLYLTSYTTYIQHGVAARVALQEGTEVVSFGNFQDFGKRLSADDAFHTRNPLPYRRDFDTLPNGSELLHEARLQLELRLSGGIDSATSYMAASAYRTSNVDVPDVRGAVVIFLHDFYDSPHVYADLVFPDFWDWICCTVETLQAASIEFLVKPHPNQIALSDGVIGELKACYAGLRMIPTDVTNRQLVDGGMVCAVTVYGTIAHEMAYLGVPSIGCARHPHVAFDFCHTARSRGAYVELLRRSPQLPRDTHAMREQALQFYVMHNLALPREQLALRDAMVAAWRTCHSESATADDIAASFGRLAALQAFDSFARLMLSSGREDAGLPSASPTWSTP